MVTTERALSLVLVVAIWAPLSVEARDFHVDPASGTVGGDGSSANPWHTLEEVVSSGALSDGTVSGGDRVLLHTGYHGELVIMGGGFDVPVTIEADEGATPTLRRVLLRNTHGWVIRGLQVSPSHAETYETVTMIDLDGASCSDNVVEGNELFSELDVSGWTADDWVNRASSGIAVDGPDNLIAGNRLTNVRFGISVGGASVTVRDNVIENFSADGLRGLGDYDVFEHNYVANSYADDDVDSNHDDGFQSWSVGDDGVGTGEVVGVVLRGNIFIGYSDPDQPFRGTLQGIGCFDGFFVDWVIENNVVATDHWHGITLLGARGARIVNNTVLDLNEERPGPPWIQIQPHKDGTASEDCIVRNNLVTDLDIMEGTGMVEDHNLVMTEPASFFVDVAAHDYHLVAGAMAIDMGSADLAPAFDRDGIPRPVGAAVDLGAHEWVPPGTDAGVIDGGGGGTDVGPRRDAGGSGGTMDGGCGCRAGARSGSGWLVLFGLLLAIARRRR
jgi:MYXO-CTERM domain-containing protein